MAARTYTRDHIYIYIYIYIYVYVYIYMCLVLFMYNLTNYYYIFYTHAHIHMVHTYVLALCGGDTACGISTAALRWPAPAVHTHVGMLNPPGVAKQPDYQMSWIIAIACIIRTSSFDSNWG